VSRLLIGHELNEELFSLNARLKAATRQGIQATLSYGGEFYSPWASAYPLLDASSFPQHLLRQPFVEPGGLVDDAEYLRQVRAFMEDKPELTVNGIVGQKHEEWIPDTIVSPGQKQVFREGRRLLLKSNPTLCRLYLEFIDFVLPLPGERSRGYSGDHSRGIIFRSIPAQANPYEIAIDLVHELGHHVLDVWQSVDPILLSDPAQPVYSEIRKTLRPAIQTYHAAVAIAYMHFFVESMPYDPACQEAGRLRGLSYRGSLVESLQMSIDSLRRDCEFTPLGEKLLQEMEDLAQVRALS